MFYPEVANELAILGTITLVAYFAWRTTYVREDRTAAHGTILVIDNNLHHLNRIPQHRVTINILRSSSQQSNISNVTETEELDLENDSIASSIDNITQSILTEASESATGLDLSDNESYAVSDPSDSAGDSIREEIIRLMDSEDNDAGVEAAAGLRQRKNPTTATTDSTGESSNTKATPPPQPPKPIRIKLKYLNDDSKLVEGNLNEGIGEFKKRNFTLELSDQKLIRLVFNGHVLQPDTKTLAACGLFDNCVVHCLIHNAKPQTGDTTADAATTAADDELGPDEQGTEFRSYFRGAVAANRDANPSADNGSSGSNRFATYFIFMGTLAVFFAILYGWYCRFQYAHLFNLNSTIGLIVITTAFLITEINTAE